MRGLRTLTRSSTFADQGSRPSGNDDDASGGGVDAAKGDKVEYVRKGCACAADFLFGDAATLLVTVDPTMHGSRRVAAARLRA